MSNENQTAKYADFAARLKMLMEKEGSPVKTVRDIQNLLEVSYEMARRYTLGTAMPRHEKLEKLSSAYGVSSGYIAHGAEDKTTQPTTQNYALEPAVIWSDGDPLREDEIEVPYFKEVAFSAGTGATQVIEETHGRKLRFGKRSLRNMGIDPQYVACATNNGRSMERLIPDGAMIAIDRSKITVKDDRIFAFDHGGLLRVKYLFKQPKGGLLLRSENKDEFPDEILSPEEVANDVRILGWVFDWSRIQKW